MNEPLVSIIVLNWNGRRWLKKCLDSLCDQAYGNYEIILVDNHSSDDSVEFVEKNYVPGRIRIVQNNENLGFAGGNNAGIRFARGEYITLLNNDAWVDSDFLSRMFAFFNGNDFDVVAPTETDYENKARKDCDIKIDLLGHPIYMGKKMTQENFYLHGVCLFFRKDFYQETLGLDDDFFMYFEEVDWFWRLNLFEKKFSFAEDILVHHAGAGSTGSGVKYNSFLWRNQNCLQMLLKNYSWYNLCWIIPLYILQNIFELVFFLLIFKPKISLSYIQGWWFNIYNLRRTLKKRSWIQKNRTVSDSNLIKKKFYFGFAKIYHLIHFKNNGK